MIIKLQITKLTTEDKPQCLAYNKSRKFETQFDADKQALELLGKNTTYKGFWKAHLEGTILNLDKELPDQGW